MKGLKLILGSLASSRGVEKENDVSEKQKARKEVDEKNCLGHCIEHGFVLVAVERCDDWTTATLLSERSEILVVVVVI